MDDCNKGGQPNSSIPTETQRYTTRSNDLEAADGSPIDDPVMEAPHSEVSSWDSDRGEYYLAIGLNSISAFSKLSYFGYLFLSVITTCHDPAVINKNDFSSSNQTATGADHDVDCSWAFVAVAMGVFPVVAMVLQEYILIALFKLLLSLSKALVSACPVGKSSLHPISTFSGLSYFGYVILCFVCFYHDPALSNNNDFSNSTQPANWNDAEIPLNFAIAVVALVVLPVVAVVLQEFIVMALFKLLLPLCQNSPCHLDVGKTTSSGPSNSSECCDKDSPKTQPYNPKKSLFDRLFRMSPAVTRSGAGLTAAEIIERYERTYNS